MLCLSQSIIAILLGTMDSTQLDTSTYESLLGGAQSSLFPESLVTTMIVSFVILNILGLLFLVFYVMNLVRNWKVQSAIFDIHKDVAAIKDRLNGGDAKPEDVPPSSSTTIADVDHSTDSDGTTRDTP